MFSVDVLDLNINNAVVDADGLRHYRQFTLYFEELGHMNQYISRSSRSKRVRIIGRSYGVFPPPGVLTEEEKVRKKASSF